MTRTVLLSIVLIFCLTNITGLTILIREAVSVRYQLEMMHPEKNDNSVSPAIFEYGYFGMTSLCMV